MKKVLWLIICLMTIVVSVNAQSAWSNAQLQGDELLGTKDCEVLMYHDNNGSVALLKNDDKHFFITSSNGIFDSSVEQNGWSLAYKNLFHAIIGYYDINDRLIDKRSCCFEIKRDNSVGSSIRYGMKRYEGKYIISYLREKKGYVRIVASLCGTNSNFDIKIPCVNN